MLFILPRLAVAALLVLAHAGATEQGPPLPPSPLPKPPAALLTEDTSLPAGVFAQLRLAEGSRLLEHWRTSVYGTLWNDPSLQGVRTALDTRWQAAATMQLDPRLVLPLAGPLRLDLLGFSLGVQGPLPHLLGTVSLHDFATQVMSVASATMAKTSVPQADQACNGRWGGEAGQLVLARYGEQLVISCGTPPLRLPDVLAPLADVSLHCDATGAVAAYQRLAADPTTITREPPGAPDLEYLATIIPEGLREHLAWRHPVAGLQKVDRHVLAPLPATTLLVLAFGVDGKALWQTYGPTWLAWAGRRLSPGAVLSADAAEMQIDNLLGVAGIPVQASRIIESLNGTVVIAIGQGVPIPTVTIALPRSTVVDEAVTGLLKQLQVEVPAEGTSTLMPLSTLPVALNLIRDVHHWVVSTDADVTTGWPNGDVGGWGDSPAGKLALSQAPADAVVLGASDTALVLRTCSQFLALAASRHDQELGQEQRLLLQLPLRLAAIAKPGYLAISRTATGLVADSRGTLGWLGLPTVTAVLGYELHKLQSARLAVDEAKAMDHLRHGILPAELLFQAQCHIDQDGNKVGEFGLMSELGGFRPLPGSARPVPGVSSLPVDLASGSLDGWHYTVFLPDAAGNAVGEPDGLDPRTADATVAKNQEKHFVAYAWPEPGSPGKRMFAILPDGVVRSAAFEGDPPDWADVFGGGSWVASPVWKPVDAEAVPPPATPAP